MKYLLVMALAVVAPFVFAQDPKKPAQDPAKATKQPADAAQDKAKDMAGTGTQGLAAEHAHLKLFDGTWDVAVKCWEKPGSEPMAMQGTDETKLVCNGTWLLTRVNGAPGGMPFQGYGLTGYDPTKKKYVGIWVDSMNSAPSWSEGDFDAKTRTLTTRGEMASPAGATKTRSTCEFKDADTRIEKNYTAGPDGAEFLSMELNFKRKKNGDVAKPSGADQGAKPATADKADKTAKPAAGDKTAKPADAAAAGMPNPKSAMHDHLKPCVGTWQAKVKMEMPGAPAMESLMTQVDTLVCGDLWLHMQATGAFNGMPFEGHGLMGYDVGKKQFVGFWVDNMAPHLAKSTGTCDAQGKVFTMTGDNVGMDGKPIKTEDVTKIESPDKKTMVMTSKTLDGKPAGTMTVEYARKK